MLVGLRQLVIPDSLQMTDLGMDKGATVMNKIYGETLEEEFHFLIKRDMSEKISILGFGYGYARS